MRISRRTTHKLSLNRIARPISCVVPRLDEMPISNFKDRKLSQKHNNFKDRKPIWQLTLRILGSVHGHGQQVELQTEKLQSGPAGLRRPAGGKSFGDFKAFKAFFNAHFAAP